MVFVQDVVRVLEKLVEIEEFDNDVFTVCGSESFSLLDFINQVNKKYYQNKLKLVFNSKNAILPKNTFVFDNTHTSTRLDMTFTNFYKGFDEYIQTA